MCRQEKINTQKAVLTPRFYRLGYLISQRTKVANGKAIWWIGNVRREQVTTDIQIVEELF
jgi:hypothetical protein